MIFLKCKHRFSWVLTLLVSMPSIAATGLSPYTTNELELLEKEFIQQINQSDSVERHPLAKQYINRIGKKLASHAKIRSPDFFIVKSSEINAFAGPGGHIGINTQLILMTANESELAGVMAHEIAHVRLHHLYGMIEHQKQMRIPMLASMLASIALGAINPTMGMGAMMGSLSGFTQENINFTRSKEKEADRIGIDMLIKAQFNPRSMAAFFQKMQESSRYYYTANVPAILRTHPLDSDRIAEAENRSMRLSKKTYQESSEYLFFKELIRVSVARDQRALSDYYKHQCNKNQNQAACQYGQALNFISLNHFQQAKPLLEQLVFNDNNNLYFQLALVQTHTGLGEHQLALVRLMELQKNYPKDYAVIVAYSQALLAANQIDKAVSVLLKGSREYKQDLPLCKALAQAQAKAHLKAYAYFTQAQCSLLEGQKRAAVSQLKVAQTLALKDQYLQARIKAKIEEITN